MQIDLATLKRIAKATPELTIAQFVAVWSEKLEEAKRIADRERHRKTPEMNAENDRKEDGKPQSREEQEAALYALGRKICGKNAGGMVTTLLKQANYDIGIVAAVLTRSQATDDPKGFVAGTIKRQSNGKAGNNIMDAFDRIELDLGGGEQSIAGNPPMRDVTPRGE